MKQAYYENYADLQSARLHKTQDQLRAWKIVAVGAWVTLITFIITFALIAPKGQP